MEQHETNDNTNSILMCSFVKKFYGAKLALNGVSLDIKKGRIVGLLGPNGSGKTTLIKIISGLLTPTSGQVLVDGIPVGSETKALISYLPERTYFNSYMKINQIIDFFSEFYEDFKPERAFDMLQRLNIDPNLKLSKLSKGSKEKVQLIMVMSRDAKLYLLDEPIAGVDPAARDYIIDTIINNYNREATIIISTHLIADIENVLDDVIFIRNGIIELQDTAYNIKNVRGQTIDQLFREVYKC